MTSLRNQKKRATAQGLADAAYALAIANGFEEVTTDEIASAAGVSRRTFANYYANKHAAVVDGFIYKLGISLGPHSSEVPSEELPTTFNELIDLSQTFFSDIFTENARIERIQEFAEMVKENPGLEPYIHAVFLEFQNSSAHQVLCERFGAVKVSVFIGAVLGSLGGIVRLILGPLAIPRDTPPLRGVSDSSQPSNLKPMAPVLDAQDVTVILTHIDNAFTHLRHGFADR